MGKKDPTEDMKEDLLQRTRKAGQGGAMQEFRGLCPLTGDTRSSGAAGLDSCELPYGYWELSLLFTLSTLHVCVCVSARIHTHMQCTRGTEENLQGFSPFTAQSLDLNRAH